MICRSYLKPGCLSGDNICVKILSNKNSTCTSANGLFAVISGFSPPWFNEDHHLSNEAFMGYRTHLIDDQVWWETHTPSCVMLLSRARTAPHPLHTHTHLILYKHNLPRQLSDSEYYLAGLPGAPLWQHQQGDDSACPSADAWFSFDSSPPLTFLTHSAVTEEFGLQMY